MCCSKVPNNCLNVTLPAVSSGEYGLIPHAAACWSDVSTTACDALSALIASHPARGISLGSSSILAGGSIAAADSSTHCEHSGACAVSSHSKPELVGPDESRPKRQKIADVATHADSQLQACESLQSTQRPQPSVPQQQEPNQQLRQHPQLVQQSGGSGSGNLAASQTQQSETRMLSSTLPLAELPSADMTGKSIKASKVLLGVVAKFAELSRSGERRAEGTPAWSQITGAS